jgi:6-phosphogluconolactonase
MTPHISDNPAVACGEYILRALTAKGHASLAVSGGSSPRKMFEWMAKQPFDWSRVDLYWVDERCVAPDHADSNYRMTREALLDHVQPASIHRIQGELEPETAAWFYEAELPERFDVVHLGMGADAHTASLFPGSDAVLDQHGKTAAVYVEKLDSHRVTLLPRMILGAGELVVLAAGADKAEALRAVFAEPVDLKLRPIQLVAQQAHWFLDPAAAQLL